MNRKLPVIILAATITSLSLVACGGSSSSDAASSSASAGSESATPSVSSNLRNTRYCEIIPSVQDGINVTSTVYNTLGLNDCPEDKWSQITQDEVNEEYGAKQSKLNGPRYWTMDEIIGMGSSVDTPTFTFGGEDGIEMQQRAVLTTKANQATVGDQTYVPNEVNRDTVFVFKAGQPVFELTDPDGNVYMMQSFATYVDTGLTYEQLPELGSKLQLPEGWSFSTRVLDADYNLSTESSDGVAYVVNDNLYNSYQRATS